MRAAVARREADEALSRALIPTSASASNLDGLSAELHGDLERAEQDRAIRTWLRNRGYKAIEIAAGKLDDETRWRVTSGGWPAT